MDSSRISLRRIKFSDVDDFLKWAGDDRVTPHVRWKTITSREEALTHIEKFAMPHPWFRTICLDDRSIGFISIKPESGEDRCRAHVSYVVAADYWGQGIATMALKMTMPLVFKEFQDLVRLQTLVEVENRASQRVLEKAGFLKEGLLKKYGFSRGEIRDVFMYSFISTDKVMEITLRPYRITDVDDFLIYAGDEKVTRFTRWNTFTSKEEALSYINNFCIPHPYCRSICKDDRSIGFVIIMLREGDDKCRADVGYALAAEYWGQGITTRAVNMAISDGFREFPDLIRIQALVEVENKASQRVLEKLGFNKEGILRKYTFNKGVVRDIVMYSLLSSDLNP